MKTLSPNELKEGYRKFQQHEKRDAMYKTATFIVQHFWGKPSEMADGLGVLLLTWNQMFYRFGPFDFDALEKCIANNQRLLDDFRERSILDYSPSDNVHIEKLVHDFLIALQICEGKKRGVQSPVSVAKALHLLAPRFFALWDDKIARAYDCYYLPQPIPKYIVFLEKMRQLAEQLASSIDERQEGKTLLKLIDEYNYAKHTKNWV